MVSPVSPKVRLEPVRAGPFDYFVEYGQQRGLLKLDLAFILVIARGKTEVAMLTTEFYIPQFPAIKLVSRI